MNNPFFKEAWQNKARHEKGIENADDAPEGYERDIKIFKGLTRNVENTTEHLSNTEDRDNIREYYKTVMDSVFRYNNAILQYGKAKLEGVSKDEMENIDFARRNVHNGLITNIGILARLMNKAGLDTSWRDAITDDRKHVQRWAQNVMYYLNKEDK